MLLAAVQPEILDGLRCGDFMYRYYHEPEFELLAHQHQVSRLTLESISTSSAGQSIVGQVWSRMFSRFVLRHKLVSSMEGETKCATPSLPLYAEEDFVFQMRHGSSEIEANV